MRRHKFDGVVVRERRGSIRSKRWRTVLGAKTCLVEKTRLGGDCTWLAQN